MRKTSILLLITAALCSSLTADTIILKSGKKYDGQVISEDDKSYLIEIRVTKSIKDQKRIPKDQVREIIKEAKDAQDFEKVEALVPTPDRLSSQNYAKRIKMAQDFITKFPKSKNTKAVKAILATLQKESQTISQGGIKLGGQLISASDVEANAYDIHARILLIEMRQYASNGQHQQALRKWESLSNQYARSTAYRESNTLAARVVNAHAAELKQLIDTLEARAAKRKSAIASLDDDDRQRTIKLLEEKQQTYEALIEKEEKEMRTKWLSIDPYHKKALEYNLRNTDAALNALNNTSRRNEELAGPTFRGAWSALAKGDLNTAGKHIEKLKSMRLPEKYTAPLAKQLAEKEVAKAAADKAAKQRAEQEKLEKEQAAAAAALEKEAEETKNKKGKPKK